MKTSIGEFCFLRYLAARAPKSRILQTSPKFPNPSLASLREGSSSGNYEAFDLPFGEFGKSGTRERCYQLNLMAGFDQSPRHVVGMETATYNYLYSERAHILAELNMQRTFRLPIGPFVAVSIPAFQVPELP